MTDDRPEPAPHETPKCQNSVEYTVAVTFWVEGGARWQTAYGRADRMAERLANYATRAAHVVEVHAVGGPSTYGQIVSSDRIRFSQANAGLGTYGDRSKRDRWIDPEFQRALDSLAEANAQARARRNADRDRRQALGCANAYRLGYESPRQCACVYCVPARHLDSRTGLTSGLQFLSSRCICGRPAPQPPGRCGRHRTTELVVLDGDPDDLGRLADLLTDSRSPAKRQGDKTPPEPVDRDGPQQEPGDRRARRRRP